MSESTAQRRVPLDARCLHCNYPLRDLPEHRCPECGQTYDPQNRLTYGTGRPLERVAQWCLRPTGRWIDLIAAILTVSLWAGIRYGPRVWIGEARFEVYESSVVGWAALLALWAFIAGMRKRVVRAYRYPRAHLRVDHSRRRFACLLFIVAVVTPGFYRRDCFHADHFVWYGIAVVDYARFHHNNCPQMQHAVHIAGNWYLHLDR